MQIKAPQNNTKKPATPQATIPMIIPTFDFSVKI
jgi:hypothetical protein